MAIELPLVELDSFLRARTLLSRDQVADLVAGRLGLTFDKDWDGESEEAEALVTRFLDQTAWVYQARDERLRAVDGEICFSINERGAGFRIRNPEVQGDLDLRMDDFMVWLLDFVGIPFQAEERRMDLPTNTVPLLSASLEVSTVLDLGQVAARVGASLGVSFGPMKRMEDRLGLLPFQASWYVRQATVIAHRVRLSAAGWFYKHNPRRVILDIQPDFDPASLPSRTPSWDIKRLDITNHIQGMLMDDAGLDFSPLHNPMPDLYERM